MKYSVVYGELSELFGSCSMKCGGSISKVYMDDILRCVGRAIDISRVGLHRCVGSEFSVCGKCSWSCEDGFSSRESPLNGVGELYEVCMKASCRERECSPK